MRKKVFAVILAGILTGMSMVPVMAAEVGTEGTEQVGTAGENSEEAPEGTEGENQEDMPEGAPEGTEGENPADIPEGEAPEDVQGEAEGENPAEAPAEEEAPAVPTINPDNYVDVEVIDLSLHWETSGDFSAVYAYDNPFKGTDTSQGVILEFYAKPTWEVHVLGAIFAIVGTGDYDGRLYFSPGSYLGFNSAAFGGYYDANLYNYAIVTDYIKDGANIRIELLPAGFSVYANDVLCYDQTILDDSSRGAGDYSSTSDFTQVLTWLAGADTLYFGYGSWWNTTGGNEANIDLSQVNFRLMDGTVVMDKLQADKELVEALGGSVTATAEVSGGSIELENVDVEVFDINSIHYEGTSALPIMVAAVAAVAVLAVAVVLLVTKKRTYDDI